MTTATRVEPTAAVEALVPMIREASIDLDRTRRIPAPVITALQKLDVFRLLAPRELGGHEVEPITFLDMVETAAYADGSVGWCAMLGGCYATFGGMLPAEGAPTIFGDPVTIAAGAFRPDGVAHEVDGGYRVTGRWPLGSGSSHATWFVGGCMILRDGAPIIGPNGAPTFRELFFPSAVTEIIDTWDATGLRGTASHDYAVSDVFVPAAHSSWFQEPPTVDSPRYRMPPIAMFATFIDAVPLGIARHAIDAFVELAPTKTPVQLAPTKTPVLSNAVLADHPVTQATLGRARATVGAGR